VRVGGALALESAGTSTLTVVAALSNKFGAQRTVVLLVNFRDKAQEPYTVDYARSVVFTTTSDFYWEGSSQQTWLTGDVYGWWR